MLHAINLTKEFDARPVLNQVNLTVDKNEVYCLLGQNGAGKTTTINIFLGFLEASSGVPSRKSSSIICSARSGSTPKNIVAFGINAAPTIANGLDPNSGDVIAIGMN